MNRVSAPGEPHIDCLQIDQLQVLLLSRSIIACYKCISEFAWSCAWSASLSSLDRGLEVHGQTPSITASQCISKQAQSPPPSASPTSIDHGLQVHLWVHYITAPQCISKLKKSRPQTASLSSLDLSLQLYLETCSLTASECISEFTRLLFSGAPEVDFKHRLQPVQVYRL